MKNIIKNEARENFHLFPKTKIIATIGPASVKPEILKEMYFSGMSCVRINTAHGDFDQYAKIIDEIKKIDNIPIMVDIKGPEIRIRLDDELKINAGNEIEFGFSKSSVPYFSYNFLNSLNIHDQIYFDNGLIEAKVTDIKKNSVILKFSEDCFLKPNKGVNLPGKEIDIPSLSEKDRQAVDFAIKRKCSFIALSFARHKRDIDELKCLIDNANVAIIAKIENHEGLNNIDEIIAASDGIMIARGDLGVELPAEKIPFIQKEIIRKCNNAGKISIVATQMLESMTNSKIPTRAEVSDVANAVLDGADVMMLSGETASGKFPIHSIKMMKKIACEVEGRVCHNVDEKSNDDTNKRLSFAAQYLAKSSNASKIICITKSGFSAKLLSRYKPLCPVLAVTDSQSVFLQLNLVWGIKPILLDNVPSKFIMPTVSEILLDKNLISKQDFAVFVGGIRTLEKNVCNLVELHNVGKLLDFKEQISEISTLN